MPATRSAPRSKVDPCTAKLANQPSTHPTLNMVSAATTVRSKVGIFPTFANAWHLQEYTAPLTTGTRESLIVVHSSLAPGADRRQRGAPHPPHRAAVDIRCRAARHLSASGS